MPLVRIPKIFKIDHRVWWALIFLSQLLICSLMAVSMLSAKWVELGPDGLVKGSLFEINGTSGTTKVNKLWHDYWKDNCDNSQWRDLGLCKMIDNLYIGSIFMGVGEALAFLCLLVWIFSFTQWIFTGKARFIRLHRPYIEVAAMVGFHFAGTILWINKTKAKYSGSCKWDGTYSSIPSPCAKDGADIAMALMVLMPIFAVIYIIIFQTAYKNLLEAKNQAGMNAPLSNNANVNVLGFIPQNNQGYQQPYGQPQVFVVRT